MSAAEIETAVEALEGISISELRSVMTSVLDVVGAKFPSINDITLDWFESAWSESTIFLRSTAPEGFRVY